MELYPCIEELAKADRANIERLLLSIGYHKLRAIALIEMANFVVKNHGGKIPSSKEALLKVPHIGPYTAGAILSFGYGTPSEMVDSNVDRIIRRFFHSKLQNKESLRIIQLIAKELVPVKHHEIYNWTLLDLGALVCRYDRPKHDQCPIEAVCDYPRSRLERVK
jgi:A/G-specific adenine glycosylase